MQVKRSPSRHSGSTPPWEFLRHNVRLLILGPAISLLLAAILWHVVFSKLENDKYLLEQQAASQATSISKAYSLYLTRTIEQLDQLSRQVSYVWERDSQAGFARMIEDGVLAIPHLISIIVIDRHGNPVAATIPLSQQTSVADRDYFLLHKTDESQHLRIGQRRVGRVSGKELVIVTRRINDDNGNFDGVVVMGVAPEFFTLFSAEPVLGEGSIMAFIGDDGMERIWKGPFSRDIVPYESATMAMRESRPVLPLRESVHHYIATQRVSGYPFFALVGLDRATVLKAHERNADMYHRIAVAGSIILFFFALLSAWSAVRLHWRKQQTDALRESYRIATEGGNEGFFILVPLRDRQGNMIDFEIGDCNERGAAFFGMTSEHLVGHTIGDFYSGEYRQSLFDTYLRAMELGYYEDVYHVPHESRVKVEWLSRKFVRSENGLAVTIRDISDAKRQEHELSKRATEDGLTSLPNRHWMMNHLPGALHRASENNTLVALLFIDLDDFKHINDNYGHGAGDQLLCDVADRLKSVIRSSDKVIRLGGDEFTIILETIHNQDEVAFIAQALIEALHEPFNIRLDSGNKHDWVGASIGIGLFPQDGADVDTLIRNADLAMYAAKNAGKGMFRFYDNDLHESLTSRRQTEQMLQQAVREDQFHIYYQPRIHTRSGELAGMEALVRWQHPERGLVLPSGFISLAEELGLAHTIGNIVLDKVCGQIAEWRKQGYEPVPVSINVCAAQFMDGRLREALAACMERYALPSSLIEIELTEASMQDSKIDMATELTALHAMGITVHIDDFGTGYSSLPQLHRLHARLLKIDEGFTAQLGRSKDGEVFFRAIISMARALDMIVVAEGVETAEQLSILQTLDCDQVQGSYVARPLPADIMHELFAQTCLL